MLEPQKHIGVAIVGLGNILLTDDGVGVHAVRKLREDTPEGIILMEVGTAILDALELFESVDSIVAIDAVQAGGSPGSIYTLSFNEIDAQRNVSLHEFGIAAAVQSLPAESIPHIMIVGMEPAVIDYGMELSPVVRAVLPDVVRTARATALQLMGGIPEQQEYDCGKISFS